MTMADRRRIGFGSFVFMFAVVCATASAAVPECQPEGPARAAGIRDRLPIESGLAPQPLPATGPVQDGIICSRGRWTKDGHRATRAEIEAHVKLVMANRLM